MINVAIVVFPGISMFHLSVPIAIFQDALLNQKALFNVSVCAERKGNIETANGMKMEVPYDLSVVEEADIVVIPSWVPEVVPSEQLVRVIQQADASNKIIAGLCLGAYALAYAGLLDNKRATSHWRLAQDFKSIFPQVNFDTNPLYIAEDNLITSAGSAAAIDCCLYLVRRFYGVKLSNQIARTMVSSPERSGGQNQYIEQPIIERASDERLARLSEHILANISDEYSLEYVASFCSMSVRSFSRHFKAIHGTSFTQWLTNARLNYALELLESTHLSVTQVSEYAGFSSEPNFRKHFKLRFDTTPNAWRGLFKPS